MANITDLPPFNPRLDDYQAEEFLAHTLQLLVYPIEQDHHALDVAPFEVKAPPIPPEPMIPLLPHVWYPKPTPEVIHFAPQMVAAPRPSAFMGESASIAAERVMRPLLAGQGPLTVCGAAGMGKTTLLQHIATHERTRQRFRRVWYFDDPYRVGQLGSILLGLSNGLAEIDLYKQLAILSNELDDDTLLVIDNLTEDHPLMLACQTLSPFVLLGLETPPEVLDEDPETGDVIIPNDEPGFVTLRRWPQADAVNLLAQTAQLHDRKGLPRELAPLVAEMVDLLDYQPLAIRIVGGFMREDDLSAEWMLGYLREAEPKSGRGVSLALDVCLASLPNDARKLLDVSAAFSPLGVPIDGLAIAAQSRNEMSLRRNISTLKRRHLLREDERLGDVYIMHPILYERFAAEEHHQPGKRPGERARQWWVDVANSATYDALRMFQHEAHLRFAYEIAERYGLHDYTARFRTSVSDYLRTYIPPMLPHDAPPPRLVGERLQAMQLARHGLEIAHQGELEQGYELITSALSQLNTHGSQHDIAEVMVMSAQIDDGRGQFDDAISTLEKAARLVYDMNALDSLSICRLGLAKAYRHAGRLKDALGVLDERPEAQDERIRIYRQMGDLKAMTGVLNQQNTMTPYAIAENYMQAREYVAALEAIANDNTPPSHNLRAMIYHIQGDYEHALLGYARALEAYQLDNPERAIPARAMGSIYALQGQFDAAEARLSQTIEETPDAIQAGLTQALLGAVELLQGNNRTAYEITSQALEKIADSRLHDDLAAAYRTLGQAAWRLGRYDDALAAFTQEAEHWQSASQRDEFNIGVALFHVGEAYRATERPDRAVANLRRALTHLSPTEHHRPYFMTLSALQRVLALLERHDDVHEVIQQIIKHLDDAPPPDLGHLGYWLGMLVRSHQRENDHRAAYKAFSRWLSTLAGRADALTDSDRPQLAILALALATRSLLVLNRPGDAEALTAEALRLADEHLRHREYAPIVWAIRRDCGQTLIQLEKWELAHQVVLPILRDEVKDEPHTFAAIYETAGLALHHLGEYRKALDHYWAALDVQPNPHKQGLLLEKAALSYIAQGQTADAVENFNEAIKFLDRNNFPGDIARVLTTLAHTLAGANRYADAIGVYEEALEMLNAVPDAAPLHTARVYESLGRSNETQGQLHQAARAYRSAIDTIEGNRVTSPDDHRRMILALARVLAEIEDFDAAIPYFEQARDAAHEWGTAQEVGNITRELAEAQRDAGYLGRCFKTYEDGLEILTTEFPTDRAAILRSYGQALAISQQFEEARRAWNEALTLTEGLSPLEIALTHQSIGQAFRSQENYADAEAAFRQALEHHPRHTLHIAATYRELGETLLAAGRPDDALPMLQAALETEKALPHQSNARLVKTLQLLGLSSEGRGNTNNAISHYHAALIYMDKTFQPALYAATLRTLGRLYTMEAHWDNAQKAFTESLDVEMNMQPRSDGRIADTLRMIADAYKAEGHLEKAATAYKKMATYANLSNEDATKLRSTLDEIERYKATLQTALDSLAVLKKTDAEIKDYVYVYALIVRMYYLLSEFEQSRVMMGQLLQLMKDHEGDFQAEDVRSEYRAIANWRLGMRYEGQGELPKARDAYRAAVEENADPALDWLIRQSMDGVM